MINFDLTLTEAIAVYKITRNTDLAMKIADTLASTNTHTLMKIEKALETQNEDFDFGEFLTELENKEKKEQSQKEEWCLEFDPDNYILVDIDTPNGTTTAAWHETRSPKHRERAIVHIGTSWKDEGTIARAYCTTDTEWQKYYIAEPMEDGTIDKTHDPDRKLFARVVFDKYGKEYDYIWNSDVPYDQRPTSGDVVMVEGMGRCICATLVEFVFQEPKSGITYKNAYTEEDYPY